MAKYAISQEGLDSLDKLSAGLMQVVTGIDDAFAKRFIPKIERLESGLGVYEKDILLCLREVIAANKQGERWGRTPCNYCNPSAKKQLSKKLWLWLMEHPATMRHNRLRKKLVLRRR